MKPQSQLTLTQRAGITLFIAICLAQVIAGIARAEEPKKKQDIFIIGQPKQSDKIEAMKALVNKQEVYRCKQVELSDKLTIKNKK